MKNSLSVIIMIVVAVLFFLVGYSAAPISAINTGNSISGHVSHECDCSDFGEQSEETESGGYGEEAESGGYN